MPYINNGSVRIYYEVHGNGHPVVLLHGFTANFQFNFANFGWIEALNERGLQVIGIEFRGHGQSDKPNDSGSYGTDNLASDIIAVLDHLNTPYVSIIGYSLGTLVALHLMQVAPDRFDKAVLVATGDGLIGIPPYTSERMFPALIEVLSRNEYPHDLPDHLAVYWDFVAETGGDREALLALAKASYEPLSPQDASAIQIPTLVISGQNDVVIGLGPQLAQALGNGEYLEFAGMSHFALAMETSVQVAVAQFLKPGTSNQQNA